MISAFDKNLHEYAELMINFATDFIFTEHQNIIDSIGSMINNINIKKPELDLSSINSYTTLDETTQVNARD